MLQPLLADVLFPEARFRAQRIDREQHLELETPGRPERCAGKGYVVRRVAEMNHRVVDLVFCYVVDDGRCSSWSRSGCPWSSRSRSGLRKSLTNLRKALACGARELVGRIEDRDSLLDAERGPVMG